MAASATVCMLPPLPPPLLVGVEDDTCYTNANSSPASSAHAVCRALKACAMLDQPLPAGHMGGKGGDDDSRTSGDGQSWIAHRIGMVLSSPPQGSATATREAGE